MGQPRAVALTPHSFIVRPTKEKTMKNVTLLVLCVVALVAPKAHAGCTYKENWKGNSEYSCDNGETGELRKNWRGEVEDTGTGTTYKENWKGNVESSTGTEWKKNWKGNVESSDGVEWKKNWKGNYESSNGVECTKNWRGEMVCE